MTIDIPYGYCHCGCGQKTTISERNRPESNLIKGEPRRFVRYHRCHSSASERFWSKVDKRGPDECWEWKGHLNLEGYGCFYMSSKTKPRTIGAHRASWILNFGDIPKDLLVCHHCDNPRCVNPKHLFLGTDRDNAIDMINKGRQGHFNQSGENGPRAKLTWEQVREIRRLSSQEHIPYPELSSRFGVCKAAICLIVNRKNWPE